MTEISVVIPAFQPTSFKALESSMSSNLNCDAEWILIDDGSGSKFDHIFATAPKNVKVLRLPENRGQGSARNTGLKKAVGRWIKFLDADDRLDKNHLSELLDAARSSNTIPFAATKNIFPNGKITINRSWQNLAPSSNAQLLRQLVSPFLHHCGALFPRELLSQLGGYDESLVTDEDGDLLLRILLDGYCFSAVEGVFYEYIHHNASSRVSTDNNISKLLARIRTCDKMIASYDGPLPDTLKEALAQRMDKIAMSYWRNFPEISKELLKDARVLSPSYKPNERKLLLMIRHVGGPSLMIFAQNIYHLLNGQKINEMQA